MTAMLHLISFGFGLLAMYAFAGWRGWYGRTIIDPSTDAQYIAVKSKWFVSHKGWDTREIDADSYDEAQMKANAWRGAAKDPEHCAVKLIAFTEGD